MSSFINDAYALCSDTSQAAPFITGTAALLKSYGPDRGIRLNDSQIKHLLKNTSDKGDNRFRDDKYGYGRINLIDAIKLLQALTQ
jgi:thermitase